ncbi:MAG: tripartite tricarboxylate transporter TctB family protein [Peptococcaceae bacterium]|nr:tripartite tricarboxylate transporter TctB family protein [Peptococcaceae bacterium]
MQRMFAVMTAIISFLGIYGSSSLQMIRGKNIGAGFMPMVFSVILLILSVIFFLKDKDQPRLKLRMLFDRYTIPGWIYYILNFLMTFLIYLIGMIPAMAVFGVTSQYILKRQSLLWATIFTVLWVAALYIVFVVLLQIPFERGLLFD